MHVFERREPERFGHFLRAMRRLIALLHDGIGLRIDPRAAIFLFGLAHGFGLATKLPQLRLSSDGPVGDIVSFNVGVELGQFAALALILIAFQAWRRSGAFVLGAYAANVAIMAAGFVLFGYQRTGYFAIEGLVLPYFFNNCSGVR